MPTSFSIKSSGLNQPDISELTTIKNKLEKLENEKLSSTFPLNIKATSHNINEPSQQYPGSFYPIETLVASPFITGNIKEELGYLNLILIKDVGIQTGGIRGKIYTDINGLPNQPISAGNFFIDIETISSINNPTSISISLFGELLPLTSYWLVLSSIIPDNENKKLYIYCSDSTSTSKFADQTENGIWSTINNRSIYFVLKSSSENSGVFHSDSQNAITATSEIGTALDAKSNNGKDLNCGDGNFVVTSDGKLFSKLSGVLISNDGEEIKGYDNNPLILNPQAPLYNPEIGKWEVAELPNFDTTITPRVKTLETQLEQKAKSGTNSDIVSLEQLQTLKIPLLAPNNPRAYSNAGGGLNAGTYYYVIVARDLDNNPSPISQEAVVTIDGTNSRSVLIGWDKVEGAIKYDVFRGTESKQQNIQLYSTNELTIIDSGATSVSNTLNPPSLATGISSQLSCNSAFFNGAIRIVGNSKFLNKSDSSSVVLSSKGIGGVNPPSIVFNRSLTNFESQRIKLQGHLNNLDYDCFSIFDSDNSLLFLSGNPIPISQHLSSSYDEKFSIWNYLFGRLYTQEIVIGKDSRASSAAIGGLIRSGAKIDFGFDSRGSDLTIAAGNGTGAGIPGDLVFQTGDIQPSGEDIQPLTTKAILKSSGLFHSKHSIAISSSNSISDPGKGNLFVEGRSLLRGLNIAYKVILTNYSLSLIDCGVECDTTNGNITITLPTAINNNGLIYLIKNVGTNVATVLPFNTETIEDSSSYDLDVQNEAIFVISNGANWRIY